MAPRKTERIVNLTICLLSTRRYVTKDQIRVWVEGYHGLSDAAFERTFERDKDDLRSMGIELDTGSNDPLFEDEVGYRIRRDEFELPVIDFTPEELAAIGAATQVWQHASLAKSTTSALTKIRAAGLEPDTDQLAALHPQVSATEPAFEDLWNATAGRMSVQFDYRESGATRSVQPWSVAWRRGRWYLLAFDVDKQEPRLFRMSRIASQVRTTSDRNAFTIPEDVNVRELVAALEPPPAQLRATVAIRRDRVGWLRRSSEPMPDADPGEGAATATCGGVEIPPGFEVRSIPYARTSDLAAQIASAGADVVVLDPAELRDDVIARLRYAASSSWGEFSAGEIPSSTGPGSESHASTGEKGSSLSSEAGSSPTRRSLQATTNDRQG